MAVATAAAIMVSPPTKMFVDGVTTNGLWSGLQQRLLPKDTWFGVIAANRSAAAGDAGLTTGSITPTPPQN
jgi:hypothetical protein